MDSKHLRIGNLFQEKKTKEIIKVIELSQEKIVFTGMFSGEWQAEPIPLTEEWLLKFGFIRNQINTISEVIDVSGNDKLLEFEVTEMGLDLWISSDKIDEALYFPVNYIKYVHQLQNLFFSLCGEELQLK